jgi:hypothetical protein
MRLSWRILVVAILIQPACWAQNHPDPDIEERRSERSARQAEIEKLKSDVERGLSPQDRATLKELRRRGKAVFWIASVSCLHALDALDQEEATSEAARREIAAPPPQQEYETMMYFAKKRMTIIETECNRLRNAGDLEQVTTFFETNAKACGIVAGLCTPKKHW